MSDDRYATELKELQRAIARLRAWVVAIVCGGLGGSVVFIATAWLLLRGGKVVGPHLALLGIYFPGYTVTWPGAFLGFFYGALIGAIAGWLVTWLYNKIVDRRHAASS
jgi:ABC-type uncharacterized transport system permease subunit